MLTRKEHEFPSIASASVVGKSNKVEMDFFEIQQWFCLVLKFFFWRQYINFELPRYRGALDSYAMVSRTLDHKQYFENLGEGGKNGFAQDLKIL